MIALLLLVTWSQLWQSLTRATSSYAATARGVSQYAHGKFKEATTSFTDADAIRHSSETAFNLGTAQVATGNRELGSSTLAKALADPKLRADALYNRGSSALAASAFDPAIRDFTDVLRIRPNDTQAKRNLEIALRRKAQQQKQSGSGGDQNKQQQGAQPQQNQPNRAPAPGDKQAKEQPKGQTDAEALLRAVQQQEQEELSRMRRVRPEGARVGW